MLTPNLLTTNQKNSHELITPYSLNTGRLLATLSRLGHTVLRALFCCGPKAMKLFFSMSPKTPRLHISIWHQWTEAAFWHQSLDISHTEYTMNILGLLFCNQISFGYKSTPHGSALLPWPSVQGRLWDLSVGGWQLSVKWWALCICVSWVVASSSTYLGPYVKHRTDNT